jgi:hypothetical protein
MSFCSPSVPSLATVAHLVAVAHAATFNSFSAVNVPAEPSRHATGSSALFRSRLESESPPHAVKELTRMMAALMEMTLAKDFFICSPEIEFSFNHMGFLSLCE